MNETITQAVLWALTLGALCLFVQRRRKRKTNF